MSTQKPNSTPNFKNITGLNADEFSINDLKSEIVIWKSIIKSNFIKLIIIGLLGCVSGIYFAIKDLPTYTANTRFMLKNEGVGSLFGGQMTGLTSLLGGGQMGTPLERTAEVISSDRIVGKALLRLAIIRDTQDLIINHMIRLSNLRSKWSNDTSLKSIVFFEGDNELEKLSNNQRKAYKIIKNIMAPEKGDGVIQKSFDKKSGVLTLSCVHIDEDFAIALSKVIYKELSDFFIEQMTFTSSNNASVMRMKLDSINEELNAVRKKYALKSDQSLGLVLQQDKVDQKALAVKEQMLSVMYAEALKNYEGFTFANQAAMPSLTLIETPYPPLNPKIRSKLKYSISFAISLIGICLLILRFLNYIKKTN